MISREIGAATRRAAELAERALAAEGKTAPCSFAVLVLGSAGRGESLLALDQDNAILFAEGEPGGPEDRYFAELGARVADTLDQMGVPYCRGGVMAREPAWRGSVGTWRRRIRSGCRDPIRRTSCRWTFFSTPGLSPARPGWPNLSSTKAATPPAVRRIS